MSNFVDDILIIGAGPAGMMAALAATGFGENRTLKIRILEKNMSPGRKILIAGSGRCNITHAGEITDFMKHYGCAERFVKPALMSFTNADLRAWFHARGLLTFELNDGKIFPRSESSRDVLRVLVSACDACGARIEYGSSVQNVSYNESAFEISTLDGAVCRSKCLILATGGASYPATGSTGDGNRLASALGVATVPLRPALTPVVIKNYAFSSCAGISLQNPSIFLFRDGKKVATHVGDVLFTHAGLSGPGILDFSRSMRSGDVLQLDFSSGLTSDKELLELLNSCGGKTLLTFCTSRFGLPERLCGILFRLAKISESTVCRDVSRDVRKILWRMLVEFPFEIQNLAGFREAMVTAGGVALPGVNRLTMASRTVPGLFFCGETLDVDGDTGGYNLQFAFSSGVLAGRSAASTITQVQS